MRIKLFNLLSRRKNFFLPFWFSEFSLFRFFSFPLSVLLKRRRLEGELHATQTVFVSITLLVRRNLLTVLISILMHGCWRRALDEETFPIFLAAQLDNLSRFAFCLPIIINFFLVLARKLTSRYHHKSLQIRAQCGETRRHSKLSWRSFPSRFLIRCEHFTTLPLLLFPRKRVNGQTKAQAATEGSETHGTTGCGVIRRRRAWKKAATLARALSPPGTNSKLSHLSSRTSCKRRRC